MDLNLLMIGIYFATILFVSWKFSKKETISEYYLNKKSTGLKMLTFSNVASLIGAGAVIGVVTAVYSTGISYGIGLFASFIIGTIFLGLIAGRLKKEGDKYNAYTIADFYEKRFDKKNKHLVGGIQIIMMILSVSTQIVGFTFLMNIITGMDYQYSLIIVSILTVTYTAMGGLRIDILSDAIQFWIFMVAFTLMALIGTLKAGGISNLLSNLPPTYLNPLNFGGLSWLTGMILMGGFFLFGVASQWQRIFSAKDTETAQKSFFYATPFIIFLGICVILFGLLAKILLPNVSPNSALFLLMKTTLPPWIAALGYVGILAIIMSSIDSFLLGSSTIAHKFFFSEERLIYSTKEVRIARIITFAMGLLSILLALFFQDIIQLSMFLICVSLIFIPSSIAGIFSNRISPNASFYSIILPLITLVITYPIIGSRSFWIFVPLSIVIVLFYDFIIRIRNC